jgi:hypothetical protein
MREFAKGQFTLRQAPRALRLIYAGFLLLAALGFVTSSGSRSAGSASRRRRSQPTIAAARARA